MIHTETVSSSFRSVEQYFQLLRTVSGVSPAPAVTLRGIDAYLMKQIAACYPVAPTVIDLAAEPTLGASTVFWVSAYPSVQRVAAARLGGEDGSPWESLVNGVAESLDLEMKALRYYNLALDHPNTWEAIWADLNPISPLFFTVSAPDAVQHLRMLLTLNQNPVIFVLPIGAIGESPALETMLALCRSDSPYRMMALRELRPFFAHSQLAVIFRRDNPNMPDILERIGHMYDGNFDFIALVENNVALRTQIRRLEQESSRRVVSSGQPVEALPAPVPAQPPLSPSVGGGENYRGYMSPELPFMSKLRGTLGLKISKAGLSGIGRAMLPAGHLAYHVTFLECSVPHQMQVGGTYEGMAYFRSDDIGPWLPAAQSERCVNMSYHWIDANGHMAVKEGMRTSLTVPVQPGESLNVAFHIIAPDTPGRYFLQPDLVHETVTWFSESGKAGPKFPVEVTY